mgnify:CR=1 FL=1|jgi:micrococcal nuclease
MRIFFTLICIFFISSCHKQELKAVKILKLFDGDSFLVQDYPCFECEEYQIRLLGIDTPESSQKPWGDKSRAKLDSLIRKDRVIYLEYDFQKIDKYKRHLAYAFTDDQKTKLINEEMVLTGYAELFAFAKDLKYLDRLKDAERIAKQSNLGIWQKTGGLKTSPYDYRHSSGYKAKKSLRNTKLHQ